MGEFIDLIYHDFKYKLYIPGELNLDKESPLMVMLHGCGQNPEDFAAGTNMNTLAEKEKFLVLYPDMNQFFNPTNITAYNPYGCWNWFLEQNQHRGKGHPKQINEIINEVKRTYKIDTNEVYAVGLSAGGSLACILGATYPDVFNGIGVCSGVPYGAANVFFLTDPMAEGAKKSMEKGVSDPHECGYSAFQEMGEFKKKMRVIVFHGICDTIVHPINGQQVIAQWAQTNFLVEGGIGHANVTPDLIESDIANGYSYTRHVYHDEDIPQMELWMIDRLGHTWSGGNPKGSYTDALGPNASEIIWNFFNNHPQQQEENVIESSEEKPTPSQVELPEHSDHPTTTQTAPEQFIEIESPVKTSIELPDTPHEETPDETPKRNIFSTLLSKFKKKKK